MNSLQRVKAALNFDCPDKVPVMNFMNAKEILFNSDVFPMATQPSKKTIEIFERGDKEDIGFFPRISNPISRLSKADWMRLPEYKNNILERHLEKDEWGCIWEKIPDQNNMGHPSIASIKDWVEVDDYLSKWEPDPNDYQRYEKMIKISKIFGRTKYKIAMVDAPLMIAANLMGFSKFMAAHRRSPEKVQYLLRRITDNAVIQMKTWKKLGGDINGFLMYDDLGTQDRPFMGKTLFGKIYEDIYGRLYQTAHDMSCEFHHHSCGKIDLLLPQLIEWGVDAMEFDSPRMCGYPSLKAFRGKIMFWGCVNIQTIYVADSPANVTQEVWHMIRNLGTKQGGYGAYFYPQWKQIKTTKTNINAFKKGLRKFGKYDQIPETWWDAPIQKEWNQTNIPPIPEQ